MSEDGMKVREKAETRFEEWYNEGIKDSDIPLEFAGPQGKKALNRSFHAGCAHIVFEMVHAMLAKKVGNQP